MRFNLRGKLNLLLSVKKSEWNLDIPATTYEHLFTNSTKDKIYMLFAFRNRYFVSQILVTKLAL